MPGAKDYVSVAYKVYKQKRLLLCNLKELYAVAYKVYKQERLLLCNLKELYAAKINFKRLYATKIGFSKFFALCPKYCKVLGSAGGHAVCVCAIHQNAVLACNALYLCCIFARIHRFIK